MDLVVKVTDDFVGLSAASAQGGKALDPGPADATHGAVKLTYPGQPGRPGQPGQPGLPGWPVVTTQACVIDDPAPDLCSVRWNDEEESWAVTFKQIPAQAIEDGLSLSGRLTVTAWDVYANRSERELLRGLEIESLDPVVELTAETPAWRDQEAARDWYPGTGSIGFDALIADCLVLDGEGGCSDNPLQAGLRGYEVRIGSAENGQFSGQPGRGAYADGYDAGAWVDHLRAGYGDAATDQLTNNHCTAEGECRIEIKATDRAGNQGSDAASVWVDRVAPVVDAISFQSQGGIGDPGADVTRGVRPSRAAGYRYFSQNQVTITVAVSDPGEQAGVGAGAKQVALYLLDLGRGQTEPVLFDTATVADGRATFVLAQDFKGAVLARVSDRVGNQDGDFYANGMLVLETTSKHAAEAHIASNLAAVSQSKAGVDASGLPLFGSNVTLTLQVMDSYSGIAEVGCTYTTETNARSRPCSPDLSGWTRHFGDPADSAAVTRAAYAFTVTDDANGIVLNWWVKDRTGHYTFASADTGQAGQGVDRRARLSVDKTAPAVVGVTWNDVSPDPANQSYYRADRQATVVVKDRNFTAAGAKIATGGAASGWTQTGARDDWTYRATISYTRDADYLASAEVTTVTDSAGHSLASALRLPDWTLDKTAPVISVSYDNTAARNSNFYGQARTATVTVQEHNFDASRVVLTDTSALADGSAGNVGGFDWTLGPWRSDGDTHSASLRFASDGKFAFAATVADRAGNTGTALGRQEFYVDQTKPAITILRNPGGQPLADGAAIGADQVVAPVVEVTDNIDIGDADNTEVTVKLTAVDDRSRGFGEPVARRIARGTSFSFDSLPALRSNDGIYRVEVSAVDNAGQEQTESVLFMVNRFGSVYLFDSETRVMVDAANPLQEPNDVSITEYNVSPLVDREVKVIRNGQDTKILDDAEFTVSTGAEHGWNKAVYSIPAALFQTEGSYEVRLWTKDQTGNVSQNDVVRGGAEDADRIECSAAQWAAMVEDCVDGAAVSFRIDKTPPGITVADLEAGGRYEVAELPVRFEVTDFFADNIDWVTVQIDGQDVAVTDLGDGFREVIVPSAFSPQSVVITAMDKSGRESTRQFEDVLVTNDRLAVWFNNTPLFVGSVIGAAVLVFGLFWLAVWWLRHRREGREPVAGRTA
jgi:hypothetical protein